MYKVFIRLKEFLLKLNIYSYSSLPNDSSHPYYDAQIYHGKIFYSSILYTYNCLHTFIYRVYKSVIDRAEKMSEFQLE